VRVKNLAFLLVVCSVAVLSSCKKSSSSVSGNTTITLTVDGSSKTFNTAATGQLTAFGGGQILVVSGASSAGGTPDIITLTVVSASGNVKAGTYTGSASGDRAAVTYAPGGTGVVYTNDPSIGSTTANIAISSITSTNVKGSFNAAITPTNSAGTTIKIITGGTFDMTIK